MKKFIKITLVLIGIIVPVVVFTLNDLHPLFSFAWGVVFLTMVVPLKNPKPTPKKKDDDDFPPIIFPPIF